MKPRYFLNCSDCGKKIGDIDTHFIGNDKWCNDCYEKNFNQPHQQIERLENMITDAKSDIKMWEAELIKLRAKPSRNEVLQEKEISESKFIILD